MLLVDREIAFRRTVQLGAYLLAFIAIASSAHGQRRYAASDNMSGYVHRIQLLDADNRRIDPSAPDAKPYSPEKTCGRCHDYSTISHGWHFNAVDADAAHGRPGQPWIWSDHRTGTHLPLSYRGWEGTYNPDELGLTRWQVAAKLGGYLPGAGVGSEASLAEKTTSELDGNELDPKLAVDRSQITGPLLLDCMLCHHNTGSGYSPFTYTEQIEQENFPYAPTAAIGLATVKGSMTRLKDDFDPEAEDAQDKLPLLTYDVDRFDSEGKVFFDLVREPKNDACYYCHTNMSADAVTGQRWLHDEDVHLQAGMACVDCHRNSIDHDMVRGFDGEQHPAGELVAALSCQGCHLSSPSDEPKDPLTWEADDLANVGRLGAPRPEHRGLPPLHFEKMTCTACHAGPPPESSLTRQVNSIAHRLGEHWKRTGEEQPGIVAAINLPVAYAGHEAEGVAADSSDASSTADVSASENEQPVGDALALQEAHGVYTPHRLMWPSMWGVVEEDQFRILNPEQVYDLIRKPLRVSSRTRDFAEEIGDLRRLSRSQKEELLGEERARVREEEWTPEEQAKVAEFESRRRDEQIVERMADALEAIEEAYPESQAVFITGGMGLTLSTDTDASEDSSSDTDQEESGLNRSRIVFIDDETIASFTKPYAWPIAHNVRPARQSLGVTGCTECHSETATLFHSSVTPISVLPNVEPAAMEAHELQDVDMVRLSLWSQMFASRSLFKVAALIAFGLTCLISMAAMASGLAGLWRRTRCR